MDIGALPSTPERPNNGDDRITPTAYMMPPLLPPQLPGGPTEPMEVGLARNLLPRQHASAFGSGL